MTPWGEDAAPCQVAEVARREAGPRHAPLLPRLVDSPAGQFVRLGLLAHLGTVVGVYFIYYNLFAVCLCLVLSFDLCLLAVDGKCCDCSPCTTTLSWSDCTPGYVSLCHCDGSSSVVAGCISLCYVIVISLFGAVLSCRVLLVAVQKVLTALQ